jgi:hypothetical protein
MLDELCKLVFIPKPLIAAYRAHLEKIEKDPTTRP